MEIFHYCRGKHETCK